MKILKKLSGLLPPAELAPAVAAALFLAALLIFGTGCEGLRFEPTEPQKQSAELTQQLAAKVDAEGCQAGSPAAEKLRQGTEASLVYIGRPKAPPDPEAFATITAAASIDADRRPTVEDVFEAANTGLSLVAELAILFGIGATGFGGKKLIDWITLAREKSKALREIVQGAQIFKERTDDATWAQFKTAQKQSPATEQLVTQIKSGDSQ